MATPNEVYNSICEAAQSLIDILDDKSIKLTQEQIKEILRKIGKINKAMEKHNEIFKPN